MLQFLLLLVLSIFIGTIVGLVGVLPDVHINNILPFVANSGFDFIAIGIIIIVSSIVFTFVVFISSSLLFIPTESNFISLLPAQKLYFQGKAYFAIYLAATGALYGFVFSIPLIILFVLFLPYLKPAITLLTPLVLFITFVLLLSTVRNIFGLLAIVFASALGLLVLQSSTNISNPLFVMISGLFGLSSIYLALQTKEQNITQKITIYPYSFLKKIYIAFISGILAIFVTLFPGIGSGVATYIGVKTNKFEPEDYIVMNGAINLLVIVMSLFASASIGLSRTGSGFWFKEVVRNTMLTNNYLIFFVVCISTGIGFFITLYLAKIIIPIMSKIDQQKISLFALTLLTLSVLFLSNLQGFIVFITAGFIGWFVVLSNNPRILLLSSIIVPVLLYFI